MTERAAILLAAGFSRRMGERNKLLLPIGGEPMVRRVARALLGACDGPVTAVLGHEAEAVAGALSDLPVTLVVNPDPGRGQASSVAIGLAHAPEAALLMIALGDLPLLTAAEIGALVAAHRAAGPDRIGVPMRGEVPGHPVLIPAALRARLMDDPDRPGCMGVTRRHPELVCPLPTQAPGHFADIDTPDAYDALIARDAEDPPCAD